MEGGGEKLKTEVRYFVKRTNMVLIEFPSPSFLYICALVSGGVHLHLLFLDYQFSLWAFGLAAGRNQIGLKEVCPFP